MRIRLFAIMKKYIQVLSTKKLPAGLFAFAFLAVIAAPIVLTQLTQAATLAEVFVRFDRMKTGEATTGTVCAKPTTASTEASVVVSFPTGYTLGAAGTFTVNTTNTAWPTGGTPWLGINTANNVSGQDVTFPSTDLVVNTLYCFNWANSAAVTVKSSATSPNTGTVTTRTSAPATIDSSTYSTSSISDDQIVVTAAVPQAFSFALSGNTDALGNLSSSAITSSPTPRTATVNTNAKNGWIVYAKDSNTGLSSTSAAYTINSTTPGTNSTLSTNADGYNTGVTSSQTGGSGTISVATAFVGGTAGRGGGLDTSLRQLATSNGTADNAVLTLTNNVTISATAPSAADYTDTITVIGAGLF